MTPDVLLVHDVLRGWVTFRALNSCEIGFLRWLTEDLIHQCVDERSIAVRHGDADFIYQTLLLNGLVVAFPWGDTIQFAGAKALMAELSRSTGKE